ncbi:MAG: hypothetical protein OJI67_18880, partial [Prosthecobacter sp.]|nr:hypothetical protein [Prosthecobacter sp.]
ILRRKQAEKSAAPAMEQSEKQEDKFFSILVGETSQEHFLEIKTQDGLRTCFSYSDIIWIVYDPDNGLNIEFGGYLVTLEGRGLVPRLFDGIKQKRVAWVKEADHELQDHPENPTFISKITITPPKGFAEDEPPSE